MKDVRDNNNDNVETHVFGSLMGLSRFQNDDDDDGDDDDEVEH